MAAAELTDDVGRFAFAFAVPGAVLSLFHALRRSDNDGALLIVTVSGGHSITGVPASI
jgi:hypothetical protein